METMEGHSLNNNLSSKAGEIYRQNSGGIYYICYHCGIHMDNIADTLTHIEMHFTSENLNNIEANGKEAVEVKYEFLNDRTVEVDSNLEEIFVDCNQSIQLQEEKTPLSNTFLCILCDKPFNGTFNLMQHTFVHFNLKAFRCLKCPAKFQQQVTVYEHMQKTHFLQLDEIVDDLQCTYCNEKAENLFEFVTHTFTHHLDQGERNNSDLDAMFNYDCRFCFANFSNWGNMRSHLLIHSGDVLPTTLPKSVRYFSDRAKSGLHRSEFLYNCTDCTKTLCGSLEARNHWITEHKSFENHQSFAKKHCSIIQSPNNNAQQKQSFKCQECDQVLSSKFSLMKHMLVHFKVQPYNCSMCSKTFSVSRNATQHMIKIHQVKPADDYSQLDCHYCKAEFNESVDFVTHMFNDHLYEHFSTEENLDGQCKYECQYCKEIFIERNLLSQHLESHKDEMIPEFDSDEGTTTVLSTKIFRHKIEFVYVCSHCPKKFRLPHAAREHVKYKHKMENHHNRRKRNGKQTIQDTHCDLCNITFITWRSMLNHRAKRHPETHKKDRYKNRQVHYCSTCGKKYQDKGNLHQHEATHTQQSYSCDICNKSYRTKYYIRTHMLSHTNEKNFICDQCGRSFYSVSKLNTHNQIHENLNLKCDQCDKVFFTRYNLTKHKNTHNNARRKCKLCDNYFKSNNSYRTHMLLHTGVKKYVCRYCDMTFAQSSGRRGHEKIRHQVT